MLMFKWLTLLRALVEPERRCVRPCKRVLFEHTALRITRPFLTRRCSFGGEGCASYYATCVWSTWIYARRSSLVHTALAGRLLPERPPRLPRLLHALDQLAEFVLDQVFLGESAHRHLRHTVCHLRPRTDLLLEVLQLLL